MWHSKKNHRMAALFSTALCLSLVVGFLGLLSGCANFGQRLKAAFNGEPVPNESAAPATDQAKETVTPDADGDQTDGEIAKNKNHRVTRDNFEEDQGLEADAGSLWKKEGQASYLFSQNNLRLIGDIINVQVEGHAASSLTNKLTIIKDTIARADAARRAAQNANGSRAPASGSSAAAGGQAAAPAPAAAGANPNSETGEKKEESKFDDVPCRIVEKNIDGSYRVKGQSPIYLGKREYHLLVTGTVRPDDINSEVVSSAKIIDGKFDLVAAATTSAHKAGNKDVRP